MALLPRSQGRSSGGRHQGSLTSPYYDGDRYRLAPQGYSICLLFLKFFECIYAPLSAGVLRPYQPDDQLLSSKRTELDRLCQRITDDLDALLRTVGLKIAA